jgi:hypothetical protein
VCRRTDDVALKALFRRAKAHEGRGDADAAQADFKRVAELQPHNADAQEEARPQSRHAVSDACAEPLTPTRLHAAGELQVGAAPHRGYELRRRGHAPPPAGRAVSQLRKRVKGRGALPSARKRVLRVMIHGSFSHQNRLYAATVRRFTPQGIAPRKRESSSGRTVCSASAFAAQ